jgi:hypothetical protein
MRRRKSQTQTPGEQYVRPSHLCCRSQSPAPASHAKINCQEDQVKIQPFPGPLQKNFKWVVTYHENGVHMNNNVLTHLRENYRRRGQDLKRNKDGNYRVVERNVIGTGKVLIPHNNVENRSTLTDNRQRRSGCERTNRSYLNYSNMPKQLAKQSACACISTEPHPGNSENHEVQPRHFLANRSGVVLALATLHCPTEWRSSSSGRKHLLRQNGEVLHAKPPST